MDIDNILISSNISCGDKNYEYFIDYMDDNYKFKPLFIMLPITSGYVKSYNDKTKGMIFLMKMVICQETWWYYTKSSFLFYI